MAYGNWGAWVFRNGVNMPNWEDQTPYREEDMTSGYLQAFDGTLDPHHAVLGGRELRLCGYKNDPRLFVKGEQVDLEPYLADLEPGGTGEGSWRGELDGYKFMAAQFSGNMIDLLLIEPDGTEWRARCGYLYGAGHMVEETPIDWCGLRWEE